MSTAHRRALSYIDKSRDFYAAQGYDTPYKWAVHDDVPFQMPAKPLADCRIGVVTTASPINAARPKKVTAVSSAVTPSEMFTADLSWHKLATHTDDVDTFLPLEALRRAEQAGIIGGISPRFYCVPTEFSQRITRSDAETITQWCADDGVDLVLLVPL